MVAESPLNRAAVTPAAALSAELNVPRRRKSRLLRSLLRNYLAVFGVIILLAVTLCAVFANVISPRDPTTGDILDSKLPPMWEKGGDPAFPLGTDELGRDILGRVIHGSRISLTVGISAVLVGGAIGVTLGLIAGYYGGRADDIIMRLADVQLAIPGILFAIAILAVLGQGQGLRNIILTLALTAWVIYARVVRGQVLSLREKEFVEAARALGARDWLIMFRHILPNVIAPVIIIASFAVAGTILAEATLSFLGLSVPPTVPTWGGMVASGRDQIITGNWWIYTFPGLAIMLTVLAINAVGDWLREYLDPRLRVL